MMTGRVNWQLEATVNIEIQDKVGQTHIIQCALDTGFNGELALPLRVIERLGLAPDDVLVVVLANGDRVLMTRYSTLINWHDQLVEAEALQTDHESVIGMALLEDSTLTIEVWDGGEVRIEPR
jgi:clan AA aspartic protease